VGVQNIKSKRKKDGIDKEKNNNSEKG